MAKKTPLTDEVARDLGYKDAKELRAALAEKKKGSLKDRLESGQGFGEAITGSFAQKTTDIKETFSKKGVKKLGKRAYRSFFSGDDIFSSYMRGRLNKKESKEELEKKDEQESGGSGDTAFTRVIAKESMMFPGMARDMNVMRQNIQKLVKLWSSKDDIDAAKGKPYAQGADEFFMREDKKEEELEASRLKGGGKETSPTQETGNKDGGMTLLAKILEGVLIFIFAKKIVKFLISMFSPKNLLKVFSKVLLPVAIIGSLFTGIKDGFKKYQETGSFSEAIIEGLKGALSFIPNLIFGEETTKKLFDSISNFFTPITKTISEIFTGIKDFFVKMFGGQVKVEDKTPAKMDDVKPSMKESKASDVEPPKTETQSTSTTQPQITTQSTSTTQPQTTTPSPVNTQTSEAKTVEKVDGETIRLPAGVKYDPISGGYEYNGRMFTANNQKEIEIIKKAIDDKKIVEYQTTDRNVGRATMTYNGATGERSLSPPKSESSSPSPDSSSSGSASVPSTGASDGGSVSASGGGLSGGGSVSASGGGLSGGGSVSASGGGSSPSGEVGSTPTTPSGASVSQASSDVAEGQRMESAADQGSVVNAPVTNNSSSSQGSTKTKSSDVYDSDLASMLVTT
jgi:hypothetical protein